MVRQQVGLGALERRDWLLASVAGVFVALHFGTWIPSLTMTTVATSTALCATQPVFAALMARSHGRDLPARAWLGIGVAVAAAAFITGLDLSTSSRAIAGDLLAAFGGAAAAAYVTVGSSARTRMSTAIYTAICYSVCALALFAACALGRQRLTGFPADAWLKIVVVTVVAQLLGHTLVNVVLRSTSATVVSLALLIEVPGAAGIAWLALHQRPPASLWLGVVLLMGGLALVVSARPAPGPGRR